MRKLILQLFLNKHNIVAEITQLQSIKDFEDEDHRKLVLSLIDAKHKEWDRYEHMIDLFFDSIPM